MESNSKRGRKPILSQSKVMTIRTSKKAKLVINGTDEVNIPKGTNLLVIRSL